MRQEKLDKESEELTYIPKTNKKYIAPTLDKSRQKSANPKTIEDTKLTSGDHLVDLYQKSKLRERNNKNSEDYWFEKDKDECKFQPSVNKTILNHNKKDDTPQSMYQVKALEKVKARM